ncbi:hypothetical protein YC2023_101490 [Brassica napus]
MGAPKLKLHRAGRDAVDKKNTQHEPSKPLPDQATHQGRGNYISYAGRKSDRNVKNVYVA